MNHGKWSLALAALLMSSTVASAHAVWIAQRVGEHAVVYGHGPSDEAYGPEKVLSAQASTATGEAIAVGLRQNEANVVLLPGEGASILAVEFDNGFWTEKADGEWVNEGKSGYPGAKSAGHYVKHATAVIAPFEGAAKPFGMALEIVPLADPLALKAGDTLPIQVLLDGALLADAEVIVEYTTGPDAAPVVTGADGKAGIVVRNDGLNVIVAFHEQPLTGDADADELGHAASLSFTLFDAEE